MNLYSPHRPLLRPVQFIVLSFAGTILAGALLLWLPDFTRQVSVSFVDALFTSTSAVCVTGLTVVDTGTGFSLWGQLIIMGLIQVGGLGPIIFSVLIVHFLTGSISLRDREGVLKSVSRHHRTSLAGFLRSIVLITVLIETCGALLLALGFARSYPMGQALYLGVFHSISAFCNAGFSLFPDNLMGYRADALVSLTVASLIVSGGLGFIVIVDLFYAVRDRRWLRDLSLHSRVVVLTTALLLLGGVLIFLVFEHGNALQGIPWSHQLLIAVFESVTPRTAGFNTVEYGTLTTITLFFTIFLMFVGGSSGSCAGGIKTNTFGALVAMVRARLRGRSQVKLMDRRLPEAVIGRAISLVVLSFLVLNLVAVCLVITEMGQIPFQSAQGRFIAILFEATSAFGTVGLSTGITPSLTSTGKLLLAFLMFVGRVGPLTLITLLRPRVPDKLRFAEEDIQIG